VSPETMGLNWLDLEMQSNQRKYQCLQILDEIIEYTQALGVLGFSNVHERTDLRRLGRVNESAF